MIDVTPRFKEPKAPKERRPWLRRKPLPKLGKKARLTNSEWQENRLRRLAFADGRCEYVAVSDGRCESPAVHVHHRGDSWDHRLGNLVAVCLLHHTYIHAHPEESYRHGWLKRRSS